MCVFARACGSAHACTNVCLEERNIVCVCVCGGGDERECAVLTHTVHVKNTAFKGAVVGCCLCSDNSSSKREFGACEINSETRNCNLYYCVTFCLRKISTLLNSKYVSPNSKSE